MRQASNNGRERQRPTGPANLPNRSFKERVGALKNLHPFLIMVWRTSRGLTAASLVLRIIRAVLPVVTLYVGKLIIDDVVLLVQAPNKPETFAAWLNSGLPCSRDEDKATTARFRKAALHR